MKKPRSFEIDYFRWIMLVTAVSLALLLLVARHLPQPLELLITSIGISSMVSFAVVVLRYSKPGTGSDEKLTEAEIDSIKRLARRGWWTAVFATPILYVALLFKEGLL